LIGVIMKRRRVIAIYWAMLAAHLLFAIVAGAFTINAVFKNSPQNLNACIAAIPVTKGQAQDPSQVTMCKQTETVTKAVVVVVLVLAWMTQICACPRCFKPHIFTQRLLFLKTPAGSPTTTRSS
jgi:hypothetical protein